MNSGLFRLIHFGFVCDTKGRLGFTSIYDIMKYKLMHNCDIIQDYTYIGCCYECLGKSAGKYIYIKSTNFHLCDDCIASIGEKETEFINNEVMRMMLIAELPIVADIQREIYAIMFAKN
jgi:hypothetical protein